MLLFLATLFTAEAEPTIHFPELFEQVDDAAFGSEQLLLISSIPQRERFTATQTTKLLEEFAFSKDKLKALRILAPHISDFQNSFLIFDAFDYASDKEQVKQIIVKEREIRKIQAQSTRQNSHQNKKAKLEEKRLYLEEKERELLERERSLDERKKVLDEKATKLQNRKERLRQKKSDLDKREEIIERREYVQDEKDERREEKREEKHKKHNSDYYGSEGYYGRQRHY